MKDPVGISLERRVFLTLGYRAWVATAYLLVAILCVLGISMEFRQIDESLEGLARERGSVLFRLVELTRDWNAQHGGVYVPVTEETQPNPYLNHPRRDLVTTDGQRLTMINPAFMTRQIAEIAEKADGVKFHITSLKPIRPANAADDWETKGLQAFATGQKHEILSLLDTESGLAHRYMAPLYVKEACLACHADQGYKLGDVRGGISISMPAQKILEIRGTQRIRALLTLGTAGMVVALLLHYVIRRSHRHFLRLQAVTAGQERLIAERTQALSLANAKLLDEVAERKKNEGRISESEARYRSVIETSQNAILIMRSADFIITFANDQAAAMIGLHQSEQLLNRSFLDFVHEPDRQIATERLTRLGRGSPPAAENSSTAAP